MRSPITGHIIVKNEDRFIWYAIQSVLPYLRELLIFDTGSTDRTVKIIKSFRDKKISFWQKNLKTPADLVKLRNEQIRLTKTSWFWLVDGDEIYPRRLAQQVRETVENNPDKYGLILHRYDLLGDIYHAQDEKVGAYDQFGKKGHYVLRLINQAQIPGLTVKGTYPNEYFADAKGASIKNAGRDKFVFIENRYWHAMYLQRSTLGGNLTHTLHRKKYKVELGKEIEEKIPEAFFNKKPEFVPNVTEKRSSMYEATARVLTPIKKIWRKINR